jgi:endonuclease/exonuclease/phosphatase family metal-dependent hydrolase
VRRASNYTSSVFLSLVLSGCIRWSPPALAPVLPGACRSPEIPWFAPDDTDERRRLDAWCAGVGGATIHSLSGTRTEAIGIEEITFVSWNVHVGNGDIRRFVDDLRAGHLTNGRRVDQYVLMLQEAVRTGGVPPFAEGASGAKHIGTHRGAASIDIADIAHELGLSVMYVPSMRNGKSTADPQQDRGNAILSTMPLSNPVAVELPGERQRRVVIMARAAVVSVGVIHLDALGAWHRRLGVFWTPWLRDAQVRSMQAQLPDGPLVIGADLNTWHGRDELAVRYLERVASDRDVSIDRRGLGLRVLDYLFFRVGPNRRAQYRQVGDRYGSDHHPLVGWVE